MTRKACLRDQRRHIHLQSSLIHHDKVQAADLLDRLDHIDLHEVAVEAHRGAEDVAVCLLIAVLSVCTAGCMAGCMADGMVWHVLRGMVCRMVEYVAWYVARGCGRG